MTRYIAMNNNTQTEIEAAVFRRLIDHLDQNKDVQNIELMNLANFCRNCLAKWYSAAVQELHGRQLITQAFTDVENQDYDSARELIYKMPYAEWKEKYQQPATQEQLDAFNKRTNKS